MFLGRYRLGEMLPLSVWTRTAQGAPALPSAAPAGRIYNAAGTLMTSVVIPIVDPYDNTGWFLRTVRLRRLFQPGYHVALVTYTIAGVALAEQHTFQVLPGGNADGAIIGLHLFNAPPAPFALFQTDGGRLWKRRNPRVAA